jgi:UDP-N-acetylglucosamine 2-epimerase (non-hydrolysing)
VFFDTLRIPEPDYNLGVGSGSHAKQTAAIIQRTGEVLEKEKVGCVVVYGDTNSTLGGTIAASKMGIPVAHVEAGMRSYNRTMPEELNRVAVDHLSDLRFCPTQTGVTNLRREGITEGVHLVGDVMFDSLVQWRGVIRSRKAYAKLGLGRGQYLLMTLHRPSNVDDPKILLRIIRALGQVGHDVVFPVHPRTRASLRMHGSFERFPKNFVTLSPLDYVEFLSLLSTSGKVLTDAGGVQKQAYFLGIPCVTLREETEWVETVQAGWNLLVGSRPEALVTAVRMFRPTGTRPRVFGNGHASTRIVRILKRFARKDDFR